MNNDTANVLLGAFLAIVSSVISDIVENKIEKKNKAKGIKTSLSDELSVIQSIVKNMGEVWEKTKTLIPSYVNDLNGCTYIYEKVRPDLYLIKDKVLRDEVITFYRDFKNYISINLKKAGSLSKEEDRIDEQKEIVDKFVSFANNADSLIKKLK